MKGFFTLIFCITLGLGVQAQEEMMFTASKNSLVDKKITVNKTDISYRSPKTTNNNIGAFGELLTTTKRDEKFTGFCIKLLTTNEALNEDANVFYFFGDVKIEMTDNNEYNYIVGAFQTKKAAQKFMSTYLMSHYTNATIWEYKNGKKL